MKKFTKFLLTLTFVSIVSAGFWWITSLSDYFLYPESQLHNWLLWGVISNSLLGIILLCWMFFAFVKFVQYKFNEKIVEE